MTYTLWDKASPINGVEAIDIIGEEQMQNDDQFIIFSDDLGAVIAIESLSTIKETHGFEGDTWEAVAGEYIAYKANESIPPTDKERIAQLEQLLADLASLTLGV